MKISGFSFARNADMLYYPVAEAIQSILPICDEFIIAVGRGDDSDRTREKIEKIGSPKIRIIDTVWSEREKLKGRIHGRQTNIALEQCSGDWCFYIQADEVLHERYLPVVKARCAELLDNDKVEGLLFDYKHFWGDYDHYIVSHAWYPREIRIVRNGRGIGSWGSAQSFRRNGKKLTVAGSRAEIFHYGWVRPPELMNAKRREFATTHHGAQWVRDHYGEMPAEFDYGSLEKLRVYGDSYPRVMEKRVSEMSWRNKLRYKGRSRTRHKHELTKYRILTALERLCGGRQLGGFRNYRLLKV